MKKLFLIFIVLLFCGTAFAGSIQDAHKAVIARGGVAAVASCTLDNDKELWAPTTQPGANDSSVAWVATKFTIETKKTITAYKIWDQDDGSDAGNLRIVLMNHDAGNDQPDEESEVANSSVSTDMDQVGSGESEIEHALGTPLALSAGTYWVVDQTENGADRAIRYTSSNGDRVCYSSNAGSTWSCVANTMYEMEVWGCD